MLEFTLPSADDVKKVDKIEVEQGTNWFVVRGRESCLVRYGIKAIKALNINDKEFREREEEFRNKKEVVVNKKCRIFIEEYSDKKELVIDGTSFDGDEALVDWFRSQVINIKL